MTVAAISEITVENRKIEFSHHTIFVIRVLVYRL